jgi:hypothetical protein
MKLFRDDRFSCVHCQCAATHECSVNLHGNDLLAGGDWLPTLVDWRRMRINNARHHYPEPAALTGCLHPRRSDLKAQRSTES